LVVRTFVRTKLNKVSELPKKVCEKFKIFLKQCCKIDKDSVVAALQNAVAYLKGKKLIKKENEISLQTGFSKGSVSSYLSGNQKPSQNFLNKFEEVYGIKLSNFEAAPPVEVDNPGVAFESIIRTEAISRVSASYIAEIYGLLAKQPATKVLKEMERLAEVEALRMLEELKKK
jgi:transcriptional regulator with XRE-family HTH domain